MITLSSTPIDVSNVKEILALISDPSACKARMEELITMAERADVQVEAAGRLQTQVDAKIAAHDTASRELSAKASAFAEYSATRGGQLSRMDETLTARQRSLETREAASIASLADREAAVQAREDSAKSRETAAAALEARNNAVKADLDRRMDIFKSMGS